MAKLTFTWLEKQIPLPNIIAPYLIWGCALLFTLFQFILQLSTGVMITPLMHSFNLTALGAGILSGSYYFIYVILQIPAGMLIDRFHSRRILTIGALICGFGCYLFASSRHLYIAETGRLLMGTGSSIAFVSTVYLAAQWFLPSRLGIMVGLAETVGMAGTLVGNILLAKLLENFTWRDAMYLFTLVAILIAILCWLIVRRHPQFKAHEVSTQEFLNNVKLVFKNLRLWFNGLYAGLLFSVVTVFVALWEIPFLVLKLQISNVTATFISAMTFVGIACGSPIMGWLYLRIAKIPLFLVIIALVSAILTIYIIYFTPHNILLCSLIMFVIGICCSAYVINYTLAHEIAGPAAKSTCIGFTNFLTMVTAPLLQPVVGGLLVFFTKVYHQINYTIQDYHYALSIVPISLIIGAFLASFIPNRKHGAI